MKTIEITLPTVQDLELQEKASRGFSKASGVTKTTAKGLAVVVHKSALVISKYSTLAFTTLKESTSKVRSNTSSYNTAANTKVISTSGGRKKLKYALYATIALVVLVGIGSLLGRPTSSDSRVEVEGAKAAQELDKEFSFPLFASNGDEISDLNYEILTAEKRDEIVVRGQKATSIKGRTFLILSIKITNNYSEPIEIDTIDYVRLSVNGNEEEWLAADIHNDPVAVQPISTKHTRIGFPVNDSDTNLLLRVGEIEGEKETINLDL